MFGKLSGDLAPLRTWMKTDGSKPERARVTWSGRYVG
jgi:hypothetical protein